MFSVFCEPETKAPIGLHLCVFLPPRWLEGGHLPHLSPLVLPSELVCPDFFLLQGRQAHWIMAHALDLVLIS